MVTFKFNTFHQSPLMWKTWNRDKVLRSPLLEKE